VEVVITKEQGCCGALTQHMGDEPAAQKQAKGNLRAWTREMDGEGLDAIIINTSGCGNTVKDYAFLFRHDDQWRPAAERVGRIAKDITEFMRDLGLAEPVRQPDLKVTYHAACSLQHGQGVTKAPKALLGQAGFAVKDVPEAHICCGSAGTYNLTQPQIASQLRDRKVANIGKTQPDVIAAGNVGCMTQIQSGTDVPVVHTAELLDWATGGPVPKALEGREIPEKPIRAQAAE
jgi:glycolate oxidase iron-sulfur subunit